jgi:hypothetical protein
VSFRFDLTAPVRTGPNYLAVGKKLRWSGRNNLEILRKKTSTLIGL